ncbi:MAG: cyclic pyranopterin monophosphate synthase MoaC [Salinirussus sp.]
MLPVLPHLVDLAGGGGERSPLTHIDDDGAATMVDIGDKTERFRRAVAAGRITLGPETVEAVRHDEIEKGDVNSAVRIGAVDAVKHAWEAIPLCHQIPITSVDTEIAIADDGIELEVGVETTARTGPEMEALHGVTTGLNVAWDMVKAVEKDDHGQYPTTRIQDVRVVEKIVDR